MAKRRFVVYTVVCAAQIVPFYIPPMLQKQHES